MYVYAFVDRKLPRTTLHGRALETFEVDEFHAVVRRTERGPAVSEATLREQHDIVMDLAARVSAILPARFGSLVEVDELERIVTSRRRKLADALALVRNREQMTVRLAGGSVQPDMAGRGDVAAASGPGARYLEQRRLAAGYPLPDAVERLTAAVRPLIAADLAEPGKAGVRAIMYHLIEKGTGPQYCDALAAASASVEPFTVKVTGPWPPFAFAPELMG